MLSKYSKAVTGAAGVIINLAYQYNVSKPNVWVSSLLALLTVAGVYGIKNTP